MISRDDVQTVLPSVVFANLKLLDLVHAADKQELKVTDWAAPKLLVLDQLATANAIEIRSEGEEVVVRLGRVSHSVGGLDSRDDGRQLRRAVLSRSRGDESIEI